MIKNCKICGREFVATNPNQKYCCETCQREALKRNRAAWIERTGWKAKDAERHRLKANALRDEQRRIYEAYRLAEIEKGKRRSEEKAKQLQERAKAGDPISQMLIALQSGGKFNAEYWQAYAAAQMEYTAGRPCTATVNGVSVLEPDFAAQVLDTLKAGELIFCQK